MLIRSLHDKVDDEYRLASYLTKAWRCSRLLGGMVYDDNAYGDDGISGIIENFKWQNVAGVALLAPEEKYFTDTLGYTKTEYMQLKNDIKIQHNNNTTPDFAHMQISLSTRLAYKLDRDGVISNLGTFCSDEDVSYLAGWLGDTTLTNKEGKTSIADDDYCADLDAENIYHLTIKGQSLINTFNEYYEALLLNANMAYMFLEYISYDTVESKVFSRLNVKSEKEPMNKIKNTYPDTYNFLCSLKSGLTHISVCQ